MNEVLNCLETRRSCRAYRPEQVPEEALQEILRAGLYAPSGMGHQSVKLLVVQDPAAIAALERLNGGVLGSPEAHPFYGAPTVCVVLADAAAFTAVEDGSLTLGNLMNAAHSLGIASCWIHRAREVFASAEGKALLHRLVDAENEASSTIALENFILGFRLGMRLAIESLDEDDGSLTALPEGW